MLGGGSRWNGSRDRMTQLPPPTLGTSSPPRGGTSPDSPTLRPNVTDVTDRRGSNPSVGQSIFSGLLRRGSSDGTPQTNTAGEISADGVELNERPASARESRGPLSFMAEMVTKRAAADATDLEAGAAAAVGSAGGAAGGQEGNDDGLLAPLVGDIRSFIEKFGLSTDASEELREIFSTSVKKMQHHVNAPGPRYRWDQIHEMITTHSPDTSLVIVNLPDPPELTRIGSEESYNELLDYMNYMDGIAENLPRVLYVHGSGQEVINFDALG